MGYILRQFQHIRKGGWPTFRTLSWRLFLTLLASPFIIITWILRPWITIRFGQLWSDRIGHFAGNTELYLCARDVGQEPQHTIDIFCHRTKICNHQLKKMWERTLRFSWIAIGGYTLNRVFWNNPHFIVPPREDRDPYGWLEQTPIHLSFTEEEERFGQQALLNMGMSANSSFICFTARDSAYMNSLYPEKDWSYHDYRDADILTYIPAMQALVQQGYSTLRMGAVVTKKLPSNMPGIIDYATTHRTEFLDIYLSARCRFFVSTGTGIDAIAMIFRRPSVFVNYLPLEAVHFWESQHLFIMKKLWLQDEHRFLTFHEILSSGVGRYYRTEQYTHAGIEIIENTPEEITDVILEMDARLKGTWQTTEEDEDLQRRFWALFTSSGLSQVFRSRIGAEFLRQNRELLE